MSSDKVLFEEQDDIAIIKLNTPEKRNALDPETVLLFNDYSCLTIEGLKKFDIFERSEVIRLWLDMALVTTPNHSQMKEIEKSFFQSRQDANPVIKFERSDRQRVGVILKKINKTLVMEKFDE